MSWIGTGVGVGTAVGGIAGGIMGSSGAKAQIQQMKEAIAYQKLKDAQTRADLTPYREFGGEQLNSLSDWLGDPNNNPMSHMDPGYGFRRDQGTKGITANAGTAGMLLSGDTLRGLDTYNQDMASQEYNNAFNRYIGEGQFKQNLASMGQNAAVSGGQLANQGAANVGEMTSNTDFGAPQRIWGDVASGFAGFAGNALARRLPKRTPTPTTPGGSNIFAGQNIPTYDIG
jgi:hypothetical protein